MRRWKVKAGGRVGAHRPSPDMGRAMGLTHSPLVQQHRPNCLNSRTVRCSLSLGPWLPKSATTSVLLTCPRLGPFCPLPSTAPYFSAFHKEARLWSRWRCVVGLASPPPALSSVQPQGHWPVLAIFIPNFSVDGLSTWRKVFSQAPLWFFFIWCHIATWVPKILRPPCTSKQKQSLSLENALTSQSCEGRLALGVPPNKELLNYYGLWELRGEQNELIWNRFFTLFQCILSVRESQEYDSVFNALILNILTLVDQTEPKHYFDIVRVWFNMYNLSERSSSVVYLLLRTAFFFPFSKKTLVS